MSARLKWILPALVSLLLSAPALAVTYANSATTFSWIDASSHAKVGYLTAPYKFNNTGGCGTTPPTLDDTLSDNIPIGFTFMYGGVNFTDVRIMSNGRLQFNNNLTCSFGSPVTVLPYPNTGLNYTLRIYGNDLDPTLKSEVPGYNTVCTSRATCYVSYATIGAAPYRSFVVTWSNVPEWAAGGSTSGNYNLQVVLQENGEFIYQYGANTAGPSAATAQVGWQVDSGDFNVPAVGLPANNSAIKFYIPQPVAEYRMEQPSWNGTAGEVLDTSGNGRHGTAIFAGGATRPADVATGKVCRGGQIVDNTAAGDISAIDTGVAVPTTVGGVGTISFWYNNSSNDRMLFDASVASGQWFYLMRTSGRRLRFVVTDSSGTRRLVETAANAIPDTGWTHIAVTWNFNALAAANSDHLRIYVNGALSATSAFTTAATISATIGTLYLGDNRSAFLDAGAPGRSAGNPGGSNATLDEFRIYNYEGGVALVSRDKNQAGACLNHYAIATSGTPTICPPVQPVQVTVTAHAAPGVPPAPHGLVTMPNNTTQITLSTSTSRGDWSLVSGYGTLNNGVADDGLATYLFNGEYQVVLNYQPTTAGSVDFNVTDGQIVESASEDPTVTVAGCVSSFNVFEPPAAPVTCATLPVTTVSGAIKTKISGTTYSLCVVALDSSGPPPQIATTFSDNVKVEVLGNYNIGVALDANNCPTSLTVLDTLASVPLVTGRASVAFNAVPNAWRDVRVRVSYPATAPTVTKCSSDNYAIRPNSLGVVATDGDWETAGITRTLNNTSTPGGIRHKAGRPFTITAAGYNGAATPAITTNYAGTPTASIVSHVIPTACLNGTACILTGGTFSDGTANDGIVSSSTASYAEVGAFNLLLTDSDFATVDESDSSTAERNITGTVAVGRFVPDHFSLTDGARTPACTTGGALLSYMGQPFSLAATLVAQNKDGATTENYDPTSGGYAPAVVTWQAENANSGTNLGARLVNATSVWNRGSYVVNSITATFNRAAAPDGAYDALQLGLQLADPDGPLQNGLDMNAATSGDCTVTSTCTARTVAAPFSARYGRLRLLNAYGSELLPLLVPVRAEFFNGANWALNTADSCTAPGAGAVVMSNPNPLGLAAGVAAFPMLGNGVASIRLTPAAPIAGALDLALNLGLTTADTSCNAAHPASTAGNLPWLQFPWCAGKGDPNARVRFGSPRAPYIYRRERY